MLDELLDASLPIVTMTLTPELYQLPEAGVLVPRPFRLIVKVYCVAQVIDSVIGAFIVTVNGLDEPVYEPLPLPVIVLIR